jgi:potassium efflux system protein
MQALRYLALALSRAAIWPVYLVILAYLARVAPWPRSLGILVSAVLTAAAIAALVNDLLRSLVKAPARAQHHFNLPEALARRLHRAGRFLVVAALALMLPVYLFRHELIAPEGRPVTAPALGRLLLVTFSFLVWGTCLELLRRKSGLLDWLGLPQPAPSVSAPPPPGLAPSVSEDRAVPEGPALRPPAPSRIFAALYWLGRRRSLVASLILAAIGSIIILDMRGYSFTARRLATGWSKTAVAITLAVVVYRALARAISRNAWRWARPSRSWAMALTSAVALRASARSRGIVPWSVAETPISTLEPTDSGAELEETVSLDDLAAGLRRLSAYAMVVLTLLATAWIWDLDLALVRFLLSQPVWFLDGQTPVTLGDVTKATAVILLGALAWRYMSTLFTVTIFPRMPDDPGVRFAVVTLCRYTVLGLATISALGAVHLDLARIGVVLAALGVGLGFGLQEVVSNFVCGIILLLERPIRIGDVVTVAGTTGKVDRINIRATTIINSDNQSMIVPNREFITGNLVNWTLKDKILRVPIKIAVAYGTDPDRVVGLLLEIARADADVLLNPEPAAALEGFGDSSLSFGLYAYVPDPSLAGGVRHRLCTEVQRRFVKEGIVIPFPTHELHLNRVPADLTRALESTRDEPVAVQARRYDPAARTPPAPHGLAAVGEAGETASQRADG